MSENKKTSMKSDIMKKFHVSGSDKKTIISSAIVLLVIALVGAILLSGLNEIIKADERNKTDADMVQIMRRILPATEYKETESGYKKTEEIHAVYEAYEGDTLIGYCVRVEVKDHMDTITLAVAVDRENTVCGVEVIKMSENAGTGIKVKNAEFLNTFKGKNSMVTAIKGTPKDNSHISVISGATVSSKAVTKGVNEAIAAVSQIEANKASEGDATVEAPSADVAEEPSEPTDITEESEVQAE